jgi:hypothetical protein
MRAALQSGTGEGGTSVWKQIDICVACIVPALRGANGAAAPGPQCQWAPVYSCIHSSSIRILTVLH